MDKIDVFDKIETYFSSFTATEKKIATYILQNKAKIMYLSITDLSEGAGVGDSSVFRFCQTLGFKGYQEFKINLAFTTKTDQDIPQLSDEIQLEDSIQTISQKVLNATEAALQQTLKLMDEENVASAIERMKAAKRIVFFGVGASSLTAMEAMNKFMRISPKVEATMDSHFQSMSASLMTPDDLAIIISYSGSTKDMLEIAEILHEKQVPIISLTRFARSPLTKYSTITLLCGANEGPLQGGSLTAKISQLYLLDVLYMEYFKQHATDSKQNKERTAKAVQEKLI